MPWAPELFSAPVLARFEERRGRLEGVPFFDGLMTGEIDALIGSFAGEPEVHHPVRGRVKGSSAFMRFVADTITWMAERNVTVEDGSFIVTPASGIEEFVLHLDGDAGRIDLPLALAADLDQDARMIGAVLVQWRRDIARALRRDRRRPRLRAGVQRRRLGADAVSYTI
jgi:hypothetical protein